MKKLLSNLVVWDYFVAVFFVNSVATLFINSYSENLQNDDVVSSIIHALIVIYGYTYFKNRKPY
jgi:hypothetical protein